MKCKYCQSELPKRTSTRGHDRIYCDQNCNNKYHYHMRNFGFVKREGKVVAVNMNCIECGKRLKGRQKKFCSQAHNSKYCQKDFRQRQEYKLKYASLNPANLSKHKTSKKIPCNNCDRMFLSWDPRYNRRCKSCANSLKKVLDEMAYHA